MFLRGEHVYQWRHGRGNPSDAFNYDRQHASLIKISVAYWTDSIRAPFDIYPEQFYPSGS